MLHLIEQGVLMLSVIAIILLFCFAVLFAIKWLFIYPFCEYCLKKETNKIQWKAVEKEESREIRINNPTYTFGINVFDLYYRVLPSELPLLVKVFKFNKWEHFDTEHALIFNQKEQFIDFVSKFKTYADIKKYNKELDNKITWIHP